MKWYTVGTRTVTEPGATDTDIIWREEVVPVDVKNWFFKSDKWVSKVQRREGVPNTDNSVHVKMSGGIETRNPGKIWLDFIRGRWTARARGWRHKGNIVKEREIIRGKLNKFNKQKNILYFHPQGDGEEIQSNQPRLVVRTVVTENKFRGSPLKLLKIRAFFDKVGPEGHLVSHKDSPLKI